MNETATGTPCPDRPVESMSRYLLTMLSVMALLYVAPFFLVRSTAYDSINPSFFARPLNSAFTTGGENANVVIFGDSTALFGIDPSQMSSALGVKALNLVNTQGSLVVNDDLALRRYLASNRPPQVIVFYFAAWDFDYGHNDFNARSTYEGQELLLRQGTRGEIAAFVRKHPADAVSFPLKFFATGWQHVLHRVSHKGQNEELAATHGHLDNNDKVALSSSCSFPPLLLDNIRFDWVHALGARYASPQTRILFYVAPVPACPNVSSVASQPYEQLPAAPPVQVPAESFSNDIRFVHALPSAVPQFTRNLSDAVRPLLAPGSAASLPAAPASRPVQPLSR